MKRSLSSLILAAGLTLAASSAALAAPPLQSVFVGLGQPVPDNSGQPLHLSDGSQMTLVSASPPAVTPSNGPSASADSSGAVFALARNGMSVSALPPMAVGESRIFAVIEKICVSASGQVHPTCVTPDVRSYRTIEVVATGDNGSGVPGAYVLVQRYGEPSATASVARRR